MSVLQNLLPSVMPHHVSSQYHHHKVQYQTYLHTRSSESFQADYHKNSLRFLPDLQYNQPEQASLPVLRDYLCYHCTAKRMASEHQANWYLLSTDPDIAARST